jgi:hypothetical protein
VSYRAPNPYAEGFAINPFMLRGSSPFPTRTQANSIWPTANLAIYVPLFLHRAVIVRKFLVGHAAGSTGNIDVGIYSQASVRLVASGATALTTTEHQVIDVTDTTVAAGFYYLALACNNNATSSFPTQNMAAPIPASMGILTEAGAYPLPATATFAVPQTLAYTPCGVAVLIDTVL